MQDDRLPKKLMFAELQCGKRLPGGPKKRYKDTLKETLKSFSINPDSWEEAAQNRSNWRVAVHNGVKYHENTRTMAAEKKRQTRKENLERNLSPASIPYTYCTRTFHAHIGLINHLRTHRKDD